MDFSMFADLTFWQWVALIVVALPITAIVLIASIFIIGVILWWTIKLAFMGAVLFIVVMAVAMFIKFFGLA
jgi:hypothetical protein